MKLAFEFVFTSFPLKLRFEFIKGCSLDTSEYHLTLELEFIPLPTGEGLTACSIKAAYKDYLCENFPKSFF